MDLPSQCHSQCPPNGIKVYESGASVRQCGGWLEISSL